MTDNVLSRNTGLLSAFFGWFVLSTLISAQGGFTALPHHPPLMMGLSVALPVLLLAMLYSRKQWLWDFTNSLDLRLLVLMNLWRFAALDFIINYYHGQLPALFAFPAGLGDIITAALSFKVVSMMQKNPAASYKYFVTWNLFGIADLLLAVTLGVLNSDSAFGLLKQGDVTSGIMSQLPHSIVPAFFVPLFIANHLLMLHRAKELRKA